ncbi:hypothetical protein R3P38DRAFT_3164338 [Favolaschia claudopus]|uniref:Uncharacterized protein n=1 Tax=Favolaschia claudopus TaxID=2862362 RepID=A0AAW0EGQ4_9AGAR
MYYIYLPFLLLFYPSPPSHWVSGSGVAPVHGNPLEPRRRSGGEADGLKGDGGTPAGVPCVFSSLDVLSFCQTRSGRPYSGWAQIDVPHFSIVDAVAAAAAVQEQDEDLSQADAAPAPLAAPLHFPATAATVATPATPPVLENLQVPSATPATSATAATVTSRDKRRYRERRRQQRAIASTSKDAIEDNRPAHIRRHLAGGLKASIQAKFHLMKTRIATTGWIGIPKTPWRKAFTAWETSWAQHQI